MAIDKRLNPQRYSRSWTNWSKERGCTAAYSWFTGQYAAVDDRAGHHGGGKLAFPFL